MRPFIVIDSETDPFKRGRIPEPFVWGLFDGKVFRHYAQNNLHSMIEWISEQKVIVYAHNGGKFDYHFLFSYMEPYDKIKIINGRIAQFYIGKAEFRDSVNILPVALGKMEIIDEDGEIIKKQEFDYSRMETKDRYKPENWPSIIDYLKDDCVTLYRMIEGFQKQYGRHLTQAGAAMNQWKKIGKVEIPKSTPEYFDKFKDYYFGGRVQCFQSGVIENDFSVFDINSAYPYAMLTPHPYGLEYVESAHELNDYQRGPAFYRIRAKSCGAYPYREKTGLSFPEDNETREFCVTGWELQAAIDTNTAGDFEILNVIYHSRTHDFREYIEYFYNQRLAAKARKDKAGDLFAKLLMNSLYGKFGANPENYAEYIILSPDERDELYTGDTEYIDSGDLGPWVLAERGLDDDDMRYYNVATAASITGYVRAYLWRAICSTGRNNALYCDTDSIATKSEGHELDTGKSLGQWKHEGEFDKAGIAGKKMYIFRGKKNHKGAREYKTASKGVKLTNNQLWKVAAGSTVTYQPENPTFSVHAAPRFVSRRISLTK